MSEPWGTLAGRAMPKSGDLRERVVIEAVELGASRREAAERFEVSVSSAVKWLQRWQGCWHARRQEEFPRPDGAGQSDGWRDRGAAAATRYNGHRPAFREPVAGSLTARIENFAHSIAGFSEPLASEFRRAAARWLEIAQTSAAAQAGLTDAVLARS